MVKVVGYVATGKRAVWKLGLCYLYYLRVGSAILDESFNLYMGWVLTDPAPWIKSHSLRFHQLFKIFQRDGFPISIRRPATTGQNLFGAFSKNVSRGLFEFENQSN